MYFIHLFMQLRTLLIQNFNRNKARHQDLQLIPAQIYPNVKDQIEVLNQFELYKTSNGVLGTPLATKAGKQIFPHIWWSQTGTGTPYLQTLALRHCSQTVNQSGAVRGHKIYGDICNKKGVN